jgi:hypothetical protein
MHRQPAPIAACQVKIQNSIFPFIYRGTYFMRHGFVHGEVQRFKVQRFDDKFRVSQ